MKMTGTLRKRFFEKQGGVNRTTKTIMTSRLLALTAALTLITIGAHAQAWVIQSVSSGQVLDVPAFSTQPGTLIEQWPENDGANQLWIITANGAGTYAIVSVNSFCIFVDPCGQVLD